MKETVIIYEGQEKNEIRKKYPKVPEAVLDKIDRYFFRYTSNTVTLRFVGVFSISYEGITYSFYCLPKYMKKGQEADLSKMVTIIKAIELAGLKPVEPESAEFNAFKSHRNTAQINLTTLAEWIVRDYLKNGIINIKSKRTTYKNRGYTNWGRTVSKVIPVTDGTEFVYPKSYHTYYETSDDLLISIIHSCVVAEAVKVMQMIGGESITPPEHNASLLGKLKGYSGFILKMLNSLYEDRQTYTLRAIYTWCREYSSFYEKPIGTVSFELVWERSLRRVFDNVSPDGSFCFDEPVYHIESVGGYADYKLENSHGIPDVININKEENFFTLIDGKYYLGEIIGGKISDVPKYHDVSKQMFYFDMLCEYGLSPDKSVNAFVMPTNKLSENDDFQLDDNNWFRYVGYVSYNKESNQLLRNKFGLERKPREGFVFLVQIEPDFLFRQVIADKADYYGLLDELHGKLLEEKVKL